MALPGLAGSGRRSPSGSPTALASTAASTSRSPTWPSWTCRSTTSRTTRARSKYVHQHTKDWSALVGASDAFIFVTPEYNYSFNAATKNAIDYLFSEWNDKVAGIVSDGGVAAGTRATQMLKQVLTTLKIMPVPEAVNIPFVAKHLDEDKRLKPTEEMEQSATAMLDEILKWTEALQPIRVK